jgi:hypothetical protein
MCAYIGKALCEMTSDLIYVYMHTPHIYIVINIHIYGFSEKKY